jgi:hypothetical protein
MPMRSEAVTELVRGYLRSWGPGGEPPEPVVEAVVARLAESATRLLTRLREGVPFASAQLEHLVIAYGLGWSRWKPRRAPASWRTGWDGVWDKPRLWLEDKVYDCMHRTSLYLEFGLFVEGYAFRPHPELSRGVSFELTQWLIEGSCRCAELTGETAGGARYSARLARCLRDHVIQGWVPDECSIFSFLWQAIKGSRAHRERGLGDFSPKGLVQGMYFWHLHDQSKLRFGPVLVWICPRDGSPNFEGLPCRQCLEEQRGKVTAGDAFRDVIPRLLIPRAGHGRYFEAVFCNCQHCGRRSYPDHPFFPGRHYYPWHLRVCPMCHNGRTAGAARSTVYLLGSRENFDGPAPLPDRVGIAEGPLPFAGIDGRICDSPAGLDPSHLDLRAAMAELEPQAQRILTLRILDQLSPVEAAQELGLSPSQARRLEETAKKLLKAKLTET